MAATAPQTPAGADSPHALVDTDAYPVDDLDGEAGRALVARCRALLAADSACVLPGFLRAQAAETARAQIAPLSRRAFFCEKTHNPYLAPDDPGFAPEHPRNRKVVSDLGALADDVVPADGVLRALYDWPALRAFVAAVLGVEALYPYADPLGSLNVNVFRPGQQLGWHFDNADWAITLMLQSAERGGVYEYLPDVRSATDENYPRVAEVLDERAAGVRRLNVDVGALVLFRGRYTIHRVTPVLGARDRLVAVLSYDTQPGVMLSEHNRMLFYGRTG